MNLPGGEEQHEHGDRSGKHDQDPARRENEEPKPLPAGELLVD
jgi:hypothetical protein